MNPITVCVTGWIKGFSMWIPHSSSNPNDTRKRCAYRGWWYVNTIIELPLNKHRFYQSNWMLLRHRERTDSNSTSNNGTKNSRDWNDDGSTSCNNEPSISDGRFHFRVMPTNDSWINRWISNCLPEKYNTQDKMKVSKRCYWNRTMKRLLTIMHIVNQKFENTTPAFSNFLFEAIKRNDDRWTEIRIRHTAITSGKRT